MGMNREIRRGDVYMADLEPTVGSEQGGVRPVLIISNNNGNYYSPTVIIAPVSAQKNRRWLPTHVRLPKHIKVEDRECMILLEQIRTIDKVRIGQYLGRITWGQMGDVEIAIMISLSLLNPRILKLRDVAVEKMKHKKHFKRAKET